MKQFISIWIVVCLLLLTGVAFAAPIESEFIDKNTGIIKDNIISEKVIGANNTESTSRLAENHPEGNIKLDKSTAELKVKEQIKLSILSTPESSEENEILWNSTNPEVATVKDGEVTGLSIGTAVITAETDNGLKAECTVTVGITETESFEDFCGEVSELIQENKKTTYSIMSIFNKADQDLESKRLIIKAKNEDFELETSNAVAVIKSTDNLYVEQFKSIQDTEAALNKYQKRDDVAYVQPDYILRLESEIPVQTVSAKSSDIYRSWGADRIGADIYAQTVQAHTTSSTSVAVLDTGITEEHPVFKNRIAGGGVNLINNTSNVEDDQGHGTHVSGIIADCTQELPNVKILPIKVIGGDGTGSTLTIGNGLYYALAKGAKVINMSLGGDPDGTHDFYIEKCIEEAVNSGATVVVAAGNESTDTRRACPAHMQAPIVVSAIDQNNQLAYFSNYGSSVDITGPGDAISSAYIDYNRNGKADDYITMSGTSQAAPHISAEAAMIRLMHPNYSASQIEALIEGNVRDLGISGKDVSYGYGLPDLAELSRKEETKIFPTNIALNSNNLNLTVGESLTLRANIEPANATDKTVTWKSDRTNIAQVDSSGRVTAISPGTAIITAITTNNLRATCTIIVVNKTVEPNLVTVTPSATSLTVGDILTLKAAVSPENASDKSVYWSSNNTSVARVDEKTGTVTALNPGTAVISAKTFNNKKGTCTITVKSQIIDPTSVTITPKTKSLTVGESITLEGAISPTNATNKTLTWSSSKTSVATVDEKTGKVKALSPGTAVITAKTSNNKKGTCTIIVKSPNINPTSVTITPKTKTLTVGQSATLKGIISPSNVTNKTLTWSSSKTKVVSVNKNTGKVKALTSGTAVITVKTVNNKKGTCTITVKNKSVSPSSVTITPKTKTLTVGQSATLKGVISPSNATKKTLTWNSSKTKVVTVDKSTGRIKALSSGTAIITAKTSNNKKGVCIVTVKAKTITPKSVTVTPKSKTLTVGQSITLKGVISPANATNKTLTWSSNKTKVVTVDKKSGKIKAVSPGTAIITAKTSNNIRVTCRITVKAKN